MTPTRWQEIERVYHAALERPPTTRDEFLTEACKNDSELRREVESLLAHDSSKTDKLDQPAWVGLGGLTALDATVTVMNPGTRLGPYRIEGPLGKGGMGEVFRAVDTRLGRPVAVKVCANQFDGRFEREARAISTLNHPHICTLYDVGPNYLVMELVEGETLAATLNKGPLPMELILRYGTQIADALAAAHARGITHRDLKPANIMVTKSGVKVLDFGLAKITRPDDAPKQSETLTASHAVMGTLSYMAPEQLEGKACDARTDIFALGLVLYEMAMGKKAFTGDSQAALIAEVMRCRPAPMESVPEKFRHVVERSLARDPEERWQTAKDVKAELLWAGKEQAVAPVTTSRSILPRWIWGFAAGIAALGLGLGWTITHFRQPAAEVRTIRLTVNPPAGTEFLINRGAAISPDGHLVAFVATSPGGVKLWVRPLDSVAVHELPGTDDATFPFWSPDSRSLGFFAGGKLKRVEVAGGLPTVICDVASGRGGSWNEQGIILFNAVNDGPLLRVSAAGGMPVPFTTIDAARGENSHRWPQFLPGGRRFLYWVRGGGAGVYLGSMDRPQEKVRVLTSATNAVYAPDRDGESGHVFWVRDGSLMAQAFDPEKGQLVGTAVPLAEAVAFGDATRFAAVSVANNGTLLYSGESAHYQLATYARDGKPLGFLAQPGPYRDLRISPDGQRLALSETDGSGRTSQIWQMEFARGIPSRVTFGGGAGPLWSPDSQRLVYNERRSPESVLKKREWHWFRREPARIS